MDALLASEPQARRFPLPGRGGEMAGLAFGPADRPLDLLFVHANGFNARTYRTILGPLAEQFHILAVDLRGHRVGRRGALFYPWIRDRCHFGVRHRHRAAFWHEK